MRRDRQKSDLGKAVALHWDGHHAPRIIATGSGVTAESIRCVAENCGIPMRSDPVLAEALAQIPLGDEIPRSLYVAVAEILAFVFMLEGIDPRETRDYSHERRADGEARDEPRT